MKMKTIKVGIMPLNEYKKRTISIAKGEYTLKNDEPKIWFDSIKSMAQILSNENQNLLKVILENHPKSLKERIKTWLPKKLQRTARGNSKETSSSV